MIEIAVGVPAWPEPSSSWDWWVLAGIAFVLVALRHNLRWPQAVPVVVAALLGGVAFAAAVHAFGVVPTLAAVAALGLGVRAIVRHAAHPRGPDHV